MTLSQIKAVEREFITVKDIAEVLHVNPQAIRRQVERDPNALGFPVIVVGKRIKIPRRSFINFMEVGR